MQNPRAVYVLSGDPITLGHIDVIKRARSMFCPLRVAIGNNPAKKYTFSLQQRQELARKALKGLPDVEVTSFEGLTVDYARLNNIPVVIRSARNTSDFNYERILHEINASQQLGIETVMLFPRQPLTHISSSAVKELQRHHGQIHEYVPIVVKEALEREISQQYIVGVTGSIGAGKSYLVGMLQEISEVSTPGYFHNIDVDRIGHEILTEDHSPMYVQARLDLIKHLGHWVQDKDETRLSGVPIVNIKTLGSYIFSDVESMKVFNEIMREPMLFCIRQKMKDKKGLLIINSALIAEAGISYVCNNNVVVVTASEDVRRKRLEERGYSESMLENRLNAQWSEFDKIQVFKEAIERDGWGEIIRFDNTSDKKNPILSLYDKLFSRCFYGNDNDS